MAIAALSVLLFGLLPARVRAWTEARVESARADVTVDDAGAADVALELRLYVHRGWLTTLSLAGFDPGLVLSEEEPPTLLPVEAEFPVYRPSVQRADDSVRLAFDRRDAPHRGTYRVMLHYHVVLAIDPESHEVRFTLPGFEAGLDGVQLVFHVPPGTELSPDSLPEATTQVQEQPEGAHSRLTLRRAHVPRTIPWIVALRLPGSRVVTTEHTVAAPERASLHAPMRHLPYAFAALFIALGWIRRRRFAARADALGLKPSPLVPGLSPLARDGALLLACLGYARACEQQPLAGLIFLTVAMLVQIERVPSALRPARPGAFRPVSESESAPRATTRARATAVLDRCLDGTQPAGLFTLALLVAAVAWIASLETSAATLAASVPFAALWWVPTFFSGHAGTLPPSLAERLAWAKAQAGLLTNVEPSVEVQTVTHQATDGRSQDARVDLRLATPALGLLRLQLLLASSPGAGGVESRACMLAVVRPGSSADRRLEIAHPELTPWTRSERRAYLIPVDDSPALALSSLAECLTRDTTPVRNASQHAA